ncbi:2,3-bisphosphoglycerate-independent phosphoglycerate mutase [Novispirillum itersonii]|uniref:2,3-bisphosphoglycerate-independent phosphoglycerate mutase n=1 Tax=Novispirillum itersonii TaxID=189 RepID=A0A7W9ZE86_NOVIT|nr:2,3-bisphosphoglycerate-independent phosphoglycerate mutase [Novispirillum itersonii]MBB6209856.1 2,3-bisphosphoglycerate-independent phosphoglycerate mutase [Novispirillum itersonii]
MTAVSNRPKPAVLCILDGWGYRPETEDNAIAQANTPTWDRLLQQYPNSLIETSGLDVGLPGGQMGNSEVGHMNIGAGRVVMQDLPRIDACLAAGGLETIATFQSFVAAMKASGGSVHLMGLLSPGGVHSHQDQMAALAAALNAHGIPVCVHAFMDGRDTAPKSGKGYLEDFLKATRDLPKLKVATVSGRYYAMDRDKRWDRVQLAYDALVSGKGQEAPNAIAAMEASYAAEKTDEFVLPTVIGGFEGMKTGDGLLMANFRADRAREITQALLDADFDGFARSKVVPFAKALGLVEYSKAHTQWLDTLFEPETLSGILGEVVSKAGLTQLRIAETEKYAHVTFFLNGGEETVYPGEKRILVPSPKVATYDLQPEMSAAEVTDHLEKAIRDQAFDLIVVNFANGDMVGHTGIMAAAVKAAETIDGCLTRLEAALKDVGGVMLVTADHGNAELMKDPETGEPYTQHTVGKVHAVLVNGPAGVTSLGDGRLADLAPTMLALMGLPQPGEMTGASLLGGVSSLRQAAE